MNVTCFCSVGGYGRVTLSKHIDRDVGLCIRCDFITDKSHSPTCLFIPVRSSSVIAQKSEICVRIRIHQHTILYTVVRRAESSLALYFTSRIEWITC